MEIDGRLYQEFAQIQKFKRLENGDVVRMELNISEQALKYYRLTDNDCPSHDNLLGIIGGIKMNTTYCMAIYLWVNGKIALTDFRIRKS